MQKNSKVVSISDLDLLEQIRFNLLRKAKRVESRDNQRAKALRARAYLFTRRIYRINGKELPTS